MISYQGIVEKRPANHHNHVHQVNSYNSGGEPRIDHSIEWRGNGKMLIVGGEERFP